MEITLTDLLQAGDVPLLAWGVYWLYRIAQTQTQLLTKIDTIVQYALKPTDTDRQ